MNYLTREEARQVNALNMYPPRKLTAVEEVIKRAVEVAEMPEVTDVLRNNKQAFMRDILRHMEEVTSNDRLIGKVRDGMTDPVVMKELVESYPYVEFEKVLNQRCFVGLEAAAVAGITTSELKICAAWLAEFYEVIRLLPRKVHAFVATPATDYNNLYLAAREGMKEAWGVTLNKELQKRIFTLFRHSHTDREIHRIFQYGLLGVSNLEERLGIPKIDRTYPTGDLSYGSILIGYDTITVGRNSVTVIRVGLTHYPVTSIDNIEGVYLFAI